MSTPYRRRVDAVLTPAGHAGAVPSPRLDLPEFRHL